MYDKAEAQDVEKVENEKEVVADPDAVPLVTPTIELNLSGTINICGGKLSFNYHLPNDSLDKSLDKFRTSLYVLHGFVENRMLSGDGPYADGQDYDHTD